MTRNRHSLLGAKAPGDLNRLCLGLLLAVSLTATCQAEPLQFGAGLSPESTRSVSAQATAPAELPVENIWQAAMVGNIAWAEAYRKKGGDLNARDPNGSVPLIHAVGRNQCGFVDYLVKQGAKVDAPGRMGWTALVSASYHGRVQCAEILLGNGARMDRDTMDGISAPFYALQNQQYEMLDLLLKHGVDVNSTAHAEFRRGQTLLMQAAQLENGRFVELLLTYKADIHRKDKDGHTAAFYAAQYNRLDNLKKLESAGAAVDVLDGQGNTLMHVVARSGSWPLVQWLQQQGLSLLTPNKAGEVPLSTIVLQANMPVLEGLLPSFTPEQRQQHLYLAAENAVQPVVEFLLKRGADIDGRDGAGRTILMKAAAHNHTWLVQYLVQQQLKINAQDNQGNTALHTALLLPQPNRELVATLLQAGADRELKNQKGQRGMDLLAVLAKRESGAGWDAL